jgi:hypothetical protein
MSTPAWSSATGRGRRSQSAIATVALIGAACVPATDAGADGARVSQVSA